MANYLFTPSVKKREMHAAVPFVARALAAGGLVLEGRMRIEQAGQSDQEVGAGGCHFVEAGETHVEIAVEDTLVLVTQGEDRG
jgi:hypothetical protein